MKNIKKIGKAVAGSALLVGATLAGAASFAAAQGGSSGDHTLGDYPQPYVGEDGNVDASIVVGSSAKAADVVGAIDIAGSLSQAAFTTEMVSAGGASFGWSATDGVSLDTRNDQLYYSNDIDAVRETLTEDNLEILQETTFRDDGGDETDIEYYLDVGTQPIQFDQAEDDEDPVLNVNVPAESSVDDGSYLYSLQANMGDSIDFTQTDVKEEEIELFGKSYTVSTDTDNNNLVLYGASDETTIDSGDSATITVDGTEHTIEVVAVTDSDTAAFRVDGELQERTEDETFTIDGSEVRITDVIQTNSQNSEGVATFAVGSEEITLTPGSPVQDGDDDDIEGTYVEMNGESSGTHVNGLSSLTIYVGAQNDDSDYVGAGETFSHDLFENVEFHFGGLNPNAAEGGDAVGEVEVATSSDDTATVSMTGAGGDDATLEFGYIDDGNNDIHFEDSDGNQYVSVEGEAVQEDEYFATDAGDFSHLWQVTSVDRDDGNEEASVELQDAVTGDSVTVEFDTFENVTGDSDEHYETEEIIDGQTYHFVLESEANTNADDEARLYAAWDGSSDVDGGGDDTETGGYGIDTGDETSVYTPVDTDSGGALAVVDDTELVASASGGSDYTFELPSTESSSAAIADVSVSGSNPMTDLTLDTADSEGVTQAGTGTVDSSNEALVVEVNGGQHYLFYGDGSGNLHVETVDSSVTSPSGYTTGVDPQALFVQPENDNDVEHAYTVGTSSSTDGEIDIGSGSYTGTWDTASMDSDDEVTAGYDIFGAYSEYDSDDLGAFTLWNPDGQATAGAAFTGQDGELSASGGAGTVESMQPAGWPAVGALDTDSNIAQLKNNRNLILVGGPVVNNLVQELANADETWSAGDYSQGQAIVQQIDNAFSQGNDALVVAGQSKEDTREAATFLANYEQNEDRMAGSDQVTLTTAQGTS